MASVMVSIAKCQIGMCGHFNKKDKVTLVLPEVPRVFLSSPVALESAPLQCRLVQVLAK